MNKKIVVLSVIALVLISATGLFLGRMLKKKQTALTLTELPAPTATPLDLTSWKDQSEFEFQYPKNLNLNTHPEDNENYAHLELTNASLPGSIILWTKDTKYRSVDDYISANKIGNYIASTLGGLPAVKILDSKDSNRLSLLAFRNGYLYQIDADTGGDKSWMDNFNLIVDSYKFTNGESTNPASENVAPQSASDEEYSEEVIE